MVSQIQMRRDTAANWTSNNPTLAAGEIGVETDTNKFKIGDGSTAWNSITDYFQTGGGSGGSSAGKLFLAAEASYLPAIDPAALTEVVGATVYAGYSVLNYDDSADEHAVWRIPVPDYDGGNMTFTFRWFAAATTGAVVWQIESVGVANSENILEAVVGDLVTVPAATVDGTTNNLNVTTYTTYNPAGVAADDLMVIEITRDADNASDTMVGDAKLMSVKVEYTVA